MSAREADQGPELAGSTTILPSGINQFPTELLLEIFTLCWHSYTPHFDYIERPTETPNPSAVSFETEIARLAHAPLLVMSQVCTRWRAIAMGTPSLWCDIELDGALWDTPSHIIKAIGLLQLTLQRSGTSPLNVALTAVVDYPFPSTILDMLAAHSLRWQHLYCASVLLEDFDDIRGKLPLLQSLELDDSADEEKSFGFLDPLPSLKTLVFPAPFIAPNFDKLPLENLSVLHCTDAALYDIQHVLRVMPRLPKDAEFHLNLYLWTDAEAWLEMNFQSLTSNISTLYLELLEDDWDLSHSKVAVGCIFATLTLPSLATLELESQEYPRCPIIWPHAEFLALSTRSGFESHLLALEIYEVYVTAPQLLECLSGLHFLERLAISDQQTAKDDGIDEHLITDALLEKLTRTPDSLCLIPRLRSLALQTFLRFDDRALLALVVSRLDDSDESQNTGCFWLELNWLPGHERQVDDAVMARFHELNFSTRRRFTFGMSAAEDRWA